MVTVKFAWSLPMLSQHSMDTEITYDLRTQLGLSVIQQTWYNTALMVINLAKEVYELDDEQVSALKDIYARPNDYFVELT